MNKIVCGIVYVLIVVISLKIASGKLNLFDCNDVDTLTATELKPGFSMGFISKPLWYHNRTNVVYDIGVDISLAIQRECILITCCVDATPDAGCNFLIESMECKQSVDRQPH